MTVSLAVALTCTRLWSVADWDNASLSNESLLDTVSRFVLASLLKHTGLLGQACGDGRYVNMNVLRWQRGAGAPLSHGYISALLIGTSLPSRLPRFTAVFTKYETVCLPARTSISSRPGHLHVRGG